MSALTHVLMSTQDFWEPRNESRSSRSGPAVPNRPLSFFVRIRCHQPQCPLPLFPPQRVLKPKFQMDSAICPTDNCQKCKTPKLFHPGHHYIYVNIFIMRVSAQIGLKLQTTSRNHEETLFFGKNEFSRNQRITKNALKSIFYRFFVILLLSPCVPG